MGLVVAIALTWLLLCWSGTAMAHHQAEARSMLRSARPLAWLAQCRDDLRTLYIWLAAWSGLVVSFFIVCLYLRAWHGATYFEGTPSTQMYRFGLTLLLSLPGVLIALPPFSLLLVWMGGTGEDQDDDQDDDPPQPPEGGPTGGLDLPWSGEFGPWSHRLRPGRQRGWSQPSRPRRDAPSHPLPGPRVPS